MYGVGKGGLSVTSAVIIIAMLIPAGVDYLAGSKHGAPILPFTIIRGSTGCTRRELFAQFLRKGQTATRASISTFSTRASATGALFLWLSRGEIGVAFHKVGMIFDLGCRRCVCGIFILFRAGGGRRFGIMGGGGGIVGEVVFIGVALRTGKREDLGTDDRGRAMHLAKMR